MAMFNAAALMSLLNAKPFAPFRFVMSDGGTMTVPSREMVLPGRAFAVVGIPEPKRSETLADLWTTVWFMHVSRIEMLNPGSPPFTAPPASPSESPTPA